MITICRKEDDVSYFILPKELTLSFDQNIIIVTGPNGLTKSIHGLDLYNIYYNVDPPDDWQGVKYKYTEEHGWRLNKNWEAPYVTTAKNAEFKVIQLIKYLNEKGLLTAEEVFSMLNEKE